MSDDQAASTLRARRGAAGTRLRAEHDSLRVVADPMPGRRVHVVRGKQHRTGILMEPIASRRARESAEVPGRGGAAVRACATRRLATMLTAHRRAAVATGVADR
jgi:hypothetical protein